MKIKAIVFLVTTLCAATLCTFAQSFLEVAGASLDAFREGYEQNSAPTNVRAIFMKAKEAVDDDDKLNLCGFYTGMSVADAQVLANYYKLNGEEWSVAGDPVYMLTLSLKGVRRVTKGGNTFDELAQAVANRLGSLKPDWINEEYRLKTIDGIVVTMSESSGFKMVDNSLQQRAWEAERQEREAREAVERRAREERKAAERRAKEEKRRAREERKAVERREKAAREMAVRRALEQAFAEKRNTAIPDLIAGMVLIPGTGYKMSKYEVTQAQWEAVMGENPSHVKGPDNPVECVSWNDCQEFLKKLNALPVVKEMGLTFRLPTEEEWEAACRAGSKGDYCRLADGTEITEEMLGQVAWFENNSGAKTHPVGQKKPNAFGLYDIHGNVCEWTATADGEYRVLRGGSWCGEVWDCESSYRSRGAPSGRYISLGFRLCTSDRPK